MNKETNHAMLDMMLRPAFCAVAGSIQKCNAAAASLLLKEGTPLESLLLSGQEELDALQSGCLYLQLRLPGGTRGAAVTRMEEALIFVLDQEDGELRALSLAARELRNPVNNLLAISSQLLPAALPERDPKGSDLLARMSKGLYQLQRTLGNMSDGAHASEMSCKEVRNISRVFDDIFEKAAAFLSLSGVTLHYRGLNQDVFGLLDADQMERAVLNILSNAMKFLPDRGEIHASLTRQGSTLRLSIQDNGDRIPSDILGSLFSRYLRQPGIEDSRHGLGLGMVMIRAAAASHGGVVLVDQPGETGTRVTLTIMLCQSDSSKVQSVCRSPLGGRNQALIELSDFLPPSVYEKEL